MLTAAHATDNGATGHLMRDNGMPHDSMANTVRLFLGTRLECAQCHNHPFDHWTQKQFFEMAAFFGSMRYRDMRAIGNYRELRKELATEDQRTRQRALQLVRRLTQGIQGTGSGVEKRARSSWVGGRWLGELSESCGIGDTPLPTPWLRPYEWPCPRPWPMAARAACAARS